MKQCEKRLPNGMCGAIGFEEIGDLACECGICQIQDCPNDVPKEGGK